MRQALCSPGLQEECTAANPEKTRGTASLVLVNETSRASPAPGSSQELDCS